MMELPQTQGPVGKPTPVQTTNRQSPVIRRFDPRQALAAAPIYRRFQRLVTGSHYARFVREYLRPESGQRILDIGCGPADIVRYLPECTYVGIDLSPRYIASARRRHGHRGRFLCHRLCDASIDELGTFDLVLAHGIVHHLDDTEALQLFRLAARALSAAGRLVTLDGCFVEGQSRVSRRLLSLDRGRYVRNKDAYVRLARTFFARVSVDIRHDLIRLPYTHIILQCSAEYATARDQPGRPRAA